MTTDSAFERIRALLTELYGPHEAEIAETKLRRRLENARIPAPRTRERFSERDITLITYGNTLLRDGEAPLATLYDFLCRHLIGTISTVHILPFFPYSSDDGFSVMDYYAVNPALGTWDDIARIGQHFRLMFDAVVNHMSAQSDWFKAFLRGEPEFQDLFFVESPETDLSSVTRPRTTPLLTAFETASGQTIHVWTTFSADQVDLDFRSPNTLLRILDVLLYYVERGADVIRLDAIGFLWKEPGTTCIHLRQTHAIVQLMRATLDAVAPHIVLITETNVPHAENVSYFGDGHNEAQLVYNFTLPPLLLHTLLSGNGEQLATWINSLETPSDQTTFFNFTASHDGIGVRPVEGILDASDLQRMIEHVERIGGRISYRNNPDGSRSPYELNVTYVDAVANPDETPAEHIRRFLLSQAVMLALAGVPAVYIHSLLGSRNDLEGMAVKGHNRAINRAQLQLDQIEAELDDPQSFRAQIFHNYLHLIQQRIRHFAFHPNGAQRAFTRNDGQVLIIERTAPDESERILALHNLTSRPQTVALDRAGGRDILAEQAIVADNVELEPYAVRWILFQL